MIKEKDFYYKKNRIAQLRGFCAVFQTNYSVTEAAEKIHIARSALSKQISALERDLGVELFDRTQHKKITPTKEGVLFYNQAVQYMNGIDGLFENFNENLKDFNNNHLNIAMHQTISTYIFPKILSEMLKKEEFKDLNVNIYNIPKEEGIKKLINKEVDLALYINSLKEEIPAEIKTIRVTRNRIFIVFNKDYHLAKKEKITIEDLKECKFLKKNIETKAYSHVYDEFDTKNSNIKIVGANFENILEIVKRTDYVSTVPELFLKNCFYDFSTIVCKNIDHLVNEAYFDVLLLKNAFLTTPMSYILKKFKELK